jgi:arginase
VFTVVKSGAISVQLGGDHTLGLGSIHGHMQAKPDIAVIWVDAHADLNPPSASPSGNIHGMPLSFLIKEVQEYMPQLPGFEWVKPWYESSTICVISVICMHVIVLLWTNASSLKMAISMPYFLGINCASQTST